MKAGCGQAEAAPRGSTTMIVRGNWSQALKGCIHPAGEAAEASIIPANSTATEDEQDCTSRGQG